MTISKAIRATRNKILEVINTCGLPLEVTELLLEQIIKAVHDRAEQDYQAELIEENQNTAGEEEEINGTD